MGDGHADEIYRCMTDGMREMFYLALLRYADDLKDAPLIEGLREAARKGAAARREQAAPTHKAVCKRFRELRKTVPKKTVRYLRVAEEFGMSERHVARIVNAAEID
jgi:AraC-like DNA-binding protein